VATKPDRPRTLTEKEVHAIARVLADPRRFEILRHIASQPSAACTDLREAFPISAATLSHHLKELESAGLVEAERCGKYLNVVFQRAAWRGYLDVLTKL
jgi:ArsR family transcriptional regulator